ncbi:MAG: C25 family cysteine peptidase, partial [Actinomycetota bacterium]|nr:C25 family cysteine peptidase [Actinomycetota bacterium]
RARTSTFRLYADGREVALRVRRDGGIEFFGLARNVATTDIRTYWLVAGKPGGRRIPETSGNPLRGSVARSFPSAVEPDGREFYVAVRNGAADNFFASRITGTPVNHVLTVRALEAAYGPARLEVFIQGFSLLAHETKIELNGGEIARARFSGRVRALIRVPVPPGALRRGRNVVTLTALGGDTDVSLLDRIRLIYPHRFEVVGDQLAFSLRPGRRAVIRGFRARRVRVADVSNPAAPRLIRAGVERSARGSVLTVPAAAKSRRLLAFSPRAVRRPAAVVAERPSAWHRAGRGADLIVIAHARFLPSLEPLRALREQQGLKVALVDVEDVYDEFSYGSHGPGAIKAFLARAAATWRPRPRFVLLVGDASYDPLNLLGKGRQDFVPTKIIEAELIEAPSDDWFVDFDGDAVPELAIGRLPVQTRAQAAAVVAKIVRYDSETPGSRSALLVADTGFESVGNELKTTLEPAAAAVETSFLGESPSAEAFRANLLGKLNTGPSVVSYVGHGAVQFWGREEVFGVKDVPALTSPHPSLFVMTTCLNGFFHDPTNESLGERLVVAERGGIAAWASSALSGAGEEIALGREFLRTLFGNPTLRLGEVVVRTKAKLPYDDVRRTAILLGDPSIQIR